MKYALIINIIWSLLLTVVFSILLISSYSHIRAIIVFLCVGYVITAFQAFLNKRWAVLISIVVAILILIRWLPMVVLNFWMFYSEDALYLDSPGTIFIVLINSVLLVLPATILCLLYLFNWRAVWLLIAKNKATVY